MSEDTEQPGPEPAAGTPEDAGHALPGASGARGAASRRSGASSDPGAEPVTRATGHHGRRLRHAHRGRGARRPRTPDHRRSVATAPPDSSYPPPPPGSWAPPALDRDPPHPVHADGGPVLVPAVGRRRPTPAHRSPRRAAAAPGKFRAWLPVALVAALVGGGIGAGVTAIADNNNNGSGSNVTIHESNAAPGAAVLSGNVTIPQLVSKVIPAVVSIDVKSNGDEDEGTGMIITSNGEVVTNNHVIELYSEGGNTGTITVTEYGQTKALPTTLVGYDQTKDVALLKINNASNLPTVTFGELVQGRRGRRRGRHRQRARARGRHAHGHPGHRLGARALRHRRGRGHPDRDAAEHDPDRRRHQPRQLGRPADRHVGPGHRHEHRRGGHLQRRDLVAEHRLRHPDRQVESLISELEKGGQSGNGGGYLGVDITTLTPALRQQYGFTPTSGAVILSVISGSPADKAGLVQGDVIVDINGTAITSSDDLQKVIQNAKPGQSVTHHLLRRRQQADDHGDAGQPGRGPAAAVQREHRPTPSAGAGSPASGTPGSTGGTP